MAGAVVQVKEAQGGGGSSTTIDSGSLTVTSGNYLWIVANSDNNPSRTLTQNAGTATVGSFTSHGSIQEVGTLDTTEHWTCQVLTSGTIDIRCTFGSSQPERVIFVAEVSGVNAIDGSDEDTTVATNPTTSMSVNVTAQPALGLALAINLQGTGSTSGAGWTLHSQFDWTATIGEGVFQTKAIVATGSTTCDFANAGGDRLNHVMIVFTDGGAVVDPVRGRRIYVMP